MGIKSPRDSIGHLSPRPLRVRNLASAQPSFVRKTVWARRPLTDSPGVHMCQGQGRALCSSRYSLHLRVLRGQCFPRLRLHFYLFLLCCSFLFVKENVWVIDFFALLIPFGAFRMLLWSEWDLAVGECCLWKGPTFFWGFCGPSHGSQPTLRSFLS